MDYVRLRTEVMSDAGPMGNYSGLSAQAAADKLNNPAGGRTRSRTSVEPREIFNAIDNGAWPATAILQDKLRAVLGLPSIDASNANTTGIIGSVFPVGGATGATRTRLLALATEPVSRAEELELGETVFAVHVTRARTGVW